MLESVVPGVTDEDGADASLAEAPAGPGSEGAPDLLPDAPAPEAPGPTPPAEAEAEAETTPAQSILETPEEEFDANFLKKAFAEDPDLAKTAAMVSDHLREANGLIQKGLDYMGHIATTPPAEGAKLLDLHFWGKVNGKVYYLRRLPDQIADSPILTNLIPKTPKPILPFEHPMADGSTNPITAAHTDRLGL